MNLIFSLLFLFTQGVVAETTQTKEGIIFDAEDATIQRLDGGQKIILKNKVQVVYQGQHISCDSAVINTKTKIIEARGHVILISPEASLESEALKLDYSSNTGEIYNGFVKVGQIIFEGERIRKIGPMEFETLQGRYTSCQTCPEAWSISGSKVNAEVGDYAYIKNSVIRIGNLPIMWLPYLVVPLKSERQTGLLFPTYAFSKASGFIYNQSFFWATADNKDITFTAKSYAKRGLKGLINHRYLISPESRGEFDFGFLQDRVFSFSKEDRLRTIGSGSGTEVDYNPNRKLLDRWFGRYKHHYELPYNFYHNLDLNLVSDTLYARDFQDEVTARGDPALESRMSITKNTDSSHFSIDSSYYQDLLNNNPLETNKKSVHRFPEINYILSPFRIFDSDLFFNLEANYVNFARDSFTYDDLDALGNPIDNDGQYNKATDLIRTGQRLDVEPGLEYPMTIGDAVKFVPTASYRETRYNFSIGEDPTTYRRYARTGFSLSADMSRIYPNIKHVITPEISYTSVPWIDQPPHPFFGTSSDDLRFNQNFKKDQAINDTDLLQFDYQDRLYEKNLINFALTNKLIRKRVRYTGGPNDYKQIVTFRLSQAYDFYEAYTNPIKPQPWSEITSLLDIRLNNFETNALTKFYPYQNTTTNSSRVKLFNDTGDYVQLTYAQDYVFETISSITLKSRTEDLTVGAGLISKYFNVGGETTLNLLKSSFDTYNYFVKLKPPGNCWGITFQQGRPKDGSAEWKLNITFLFDGKTETTF